MMAEKYLPGNMNVYQAQHILYVASRCKRLKFPEGAKELMTRLVDLDFYLRANSLKDSELFKQLDKRLSNLKHKGNEQDVFLHLQEFISLHASFIAYHFRLIQ